MRKFYFLLLILTLAASTQAQITASSYPFTTAAATVLEDMSSGTTQIIAPGTDDAASTVNSIGFSFWYDGTQYSQFSVNANGLMRLGSTVVSAAFANNLASTTDAPKLTAYHDDLRVGSNGKVHFKVNGTAPNRKLIVEWLNEQVPRGTAGNPGAARFQVWLYETTGVIEFVYGTGIVLNSANLGYSVGLQSGAATNFASITTTSATVSYVASNNTQTNAIANGTRYTFSPPVPANPTTLSFTAVTVGGMTLNWADNSTNETGFLIFRSTDGVNYSFVNQVAANTTSSIQTGLSGSTLYYWRVYAVSSGALSATPASGSQITGACTLTGTRTIGPAGDYATITAAIADALATGLGGPVIFELNAAYLSSSEPAFPIVIPILPCASSVNTLTIRPGAGATATISGSSTSSILKLNGADWIIIDGSNNGSNSRDLTITNTNSAAATAGIWISSLGSTSGATNNVIRNCNISCGVDQSASALETFGIISSGAAIANNNDGLDNNNNTYQNNSVTRARWGIFIRGGAAGVNSGLNINSNVVGPAAFGSNEIGKGGIIILHQNGAVVTANEVRFVGGAFGNTTAGSDRTGMGIGAFDGPSPTATVMIGATVTGNNIHDIVEERTFSALGLVLASISIPSTNTVANNFINRVRTNATTGDQGIGLEIFRGDGDQVVFNTVSLVSPDTDPVGTVTGNESNIGVRIAGAAVTNLTFANNLVNADVSSNTPGLRHFAIVAPAAYVWGTGSSNYNNYYVSGTNAQMSLGGIGTTGAITPITSLATWRTQFSPAQEANSLNLQPLFVSLNDLHLDVNSNSLLDNKGTTIAGITTDIDATVRSGTTPDIGADEFASLACGGAIGGTASAGTANLCGPGNPNITATGYSTGTGSTYQWQSSNDNFVTNIVDIPGQTNPATLTTGIVSANTWYRLRVTCPLGLATDFSTTVAVSLVTFSTSAVISNSAGPSAQLNEGFGAVIPAGWSAQNNSLPQPALGWFQGNSATVFPAHSGAPDDYAAANFNSTIGAGTISNWLISPILHVANGDVLTFYTRTVDVPQFADRLQVRLSTSGSSVDVGTLPDDVGVFTNLLIDINPFLSLVGYPSAWTQFSVTIAGLTVPTSGRIAFRYFVHDGGSGSNSDYIGLDDVLYTSPGGNICSGTVANIKVDITGGVSPYTLVYSNGVTNTTVPGYVSGTNIPVSPIATTTYSLVSVSSANGCAGTGNSGPVILNVFSTPVVNSGPLAQTACIGSGATFSVVVNALDPTFQWQESTDGGTSFNDIAGANLTDLTLPPTTLTQDGNQYRVVISSSCGTSTSPAARLTVKVLPTHTGISTTPNPACEGSTITIAATATGGSLSPGDAVLASSGNINLAIPDATPAGVSSTITLPSFNVAAAADLKVRLNLIHPFTGDLIVTLTSPCGTTFVFDRPGVPAIAFGNSNPLSGIYVFDLAGATIFPESGLVPAGTYQPTNTGGTQNPWVGLTFPCTTGGDWKITISDNATGDAGTLVEWAIIAATTGLYSHTLTGPGTILQQNSTGTSFETAHFTVSGLTPGTYTFNLTSTTNTGCAVSTPISIEISEPDFYITPANPAICEGSSQVLTVVEQKTFKSIDPITIPDAGVSTPYPATLTVSGLPVNAVIHSVKLNGLSHDFLSDVDVLLKSPTGTNVILMSDVGGNHAASGVDYSFEDGAPLMTTGTNLSGTNRPTNLVGPGIQPDDFPTPGPGSVDQASPALSTITGDPNGVWSLYVVDDFAGDAGSITGWSISFSVPGITSTYTWSPATGLSSTSGPVVTANPTTTTAYTVSAVSTLGCTKDIPVTVVVNQVTAITVQPTPATQVICPGFNVTYQVTATGTNLTYQWRKDGVVLLDGGSIFGANTNTLILSNVGTADAGTYDVVVSGACPPVTSNPLVLQVGNTPVITQQPADTGACEGSTLTFSVVANAIPALAIYQWQVSTDGGTSWTDLTTGGSYTATLTLSNVTLAMSGNQYRVISTTACNITTTSDPATLTVSTPVAITLGDLPSRICLSDTLVSLADIGLPTGGIWSGTGVRSGTNFFPDSTAVGTYTLTYSLTNSSGCTAKATVLAVVEDCQDRIIRLRDDAVILWPNPNDGHFFIRIHSTLYNYLGIRIYSSTGQLIKIQNLTGLVYGQVLPMDISYLPGGVYMVEFYYDDGIRTSQKTFKVVVSH